MKVIEKVGDYIDREDALRPFIIDKNGQRIPEVDGDNFPVTIEIKEVKRILRALPSADVKPVVRCENCVHWNGETHGCTRNPSLEPWWESDFCNYWEKVRKE